MTDIEKILVIRLSSIGDIILATPLLRRLREAYPKAGITFVIKKQFAPLLADSPYIDELITFDKSLGFKGLRELKRHLRECHFQICIDIHKNWRSLYLRTGLGTWLTGTYPKYILRRTLLIHLKLNLYRHIKPVYERYFESVRKLGLHDDGKGTDIYVPPAITRRISEMVSSLGYRAGFPLVIVCPGATYSNKRWKKDGFIKTGIELIRQRSAFIVVHGGKEDDALCREIAAEIGPGAVSMAGKLSLIESAALLQISRLVIANDSGLLHLAQSQKRPVVGIYGPTTRELGFYPLKTDSTVVETEVSCRPCTAKGLNYCPRTHFRCMNDIDPQRVIAAALAYLH